MNKQTLTVKITKASKPTYWYSSLIGQVFEVEENPYSEMHSFNFVVVNEASRLNGGGIEQQDCEIINRFYKDTSSLRKEEANLKHKILLVFQNRIEAIQKRTTEELFFIIEPTVFDPITVDNFTSIVGVNCYGKAIARFESNPPSFEIDPQELTIEQQIWLIELIDKYLLP